MTTADDVIQWAKDQGALISSSLEFLEVSPNNIGSICKSTEEDPALSGYHIRIPLDIAITLKDAIDSFNYGAYGDFKQISNQTKNINSVLKLYLARERSKEYIDKSLYRPYIKCLPGLQNITSPYCWTPREKLLLKGTNLGHSLKDNLGSLVEEWWNIINLLPQELPKPKDHFINMKFYYEFKFHNDDDLYNYLVKEETPDNWTSFPNYLWSSFILKSRAFPAYLIKNVDQTLDIKLDEVILLPVIDFLNHEPSANVEWSVSNTDSTNYFNLKSNSLEAGLEAFNNYGRKGNEELLLSYGFCIENNQADSCALRLKLPIEFLPEVENNGIRLPKMEDFTTSVVRGQESEGNSTGKYDEFKDGLLFFVTADHIPDDLIRLFQFLSRSKWEPNSSLRLELSGLNKLREAFEAKLEVMGPLNLPDDNFNSRNIKIYVESQSRILNSAIKQAKRIEKQILSKDDNKPKLISLKTVYKNDKKLAQSLLVSLGVTSYEQLLESNFQDQTWLLYLMRCYNKNEYKDESEDDQYLPDWIKTAFDRLVKDYTPNSNEVLQFKELYESLIIPLSQTVPEIYNRGDWTVEKVIISARLLDLISFARGKQQESILVEQ